MISPSHDVEGYADATIPRVTSAADDSAATLCLSVISSDPPKVIAVDAELVIGRDSSADLVVADGGVSRRHARLRSAAGRYELADLGSTNGTCVNGAAIQKVELHPGDRIEIGDFVAKLLPLDDPEVIAQQRLLERIERDPLTGAFNRGAFDAMLAEAIRETTPFGVILLDLDKFKSVNDTYGHPVGDEVLREAVRRLDQIVAAPNQLARYGGEEFAVFVPSPLAIPATVASAARLALATIPFKTAAGSLPITASFGIADWRDDETASDCVARADLALYESKRNGRNRVTVAG